MADEISKAILKDICSKRAVIFDLDGTLVDSMWMWYDIDVKFLGRYGIPCPSDLQHMIEGMSFSETADYFKARFSLPESTDEIKEIWTEMSLDKYANDVPLRTGAMKFLRFLRSNDIAIGLATSNGPDMVHAVLRSNDIDSFFSCIETAGEVPRGKPAPDIYLRAAEELDTDPSDCFVFEDVPAGIRSGKAAGMKVCAVEDENASPYRDEIIALADYYIHDYEEILL